MKPNPIPVIAALLFVSVSLQAQENKDSSADDPRFRLQLKNGGLIPRKNITAATLDLFNRTALRVQGKAYSIIQFEHIPTTEERQLMLKAGIELLDYIPSNAYTATISGSLNVSVLDQVKARAILEPDVKQKMESGLAEGIFPPWDVKIAGSVDLWIRFPRTFLYETVYGELRNRNFEVISTIYKDYQVIEVRASFLRLYELASLPFIEYMEPAPHEEQLLNNKSTVNSRANVLSSALPWGRNLKGHGVVIGIGDDADPLRHIDFTGRMINRAAINGGIHGVHVEGIAGGAGIVLEQYAGAAPKSTIIAQYFSNILVNASAYVQDYGMVITNNSYGNITNDCATFGIYTLYSNILDQQAIDMPNLEQVFASGNSGLFTCSPYISGFSNVLGDYQSSKNTICVGNASELGVINATSSKGPVRDGRIKPEICAQGIIVRSTFPTNTYGNNSGTSIASPAVAGGLALLYEHYRLLHSGATPKNGLMKALLCNGATDKGNAGPDFSYGFGWMNLLRSAKMLEQNNYFNDSVAVGITNTHTITVPSNTAFLKVMLYWNDPPAAAMASHSLVNDLDLTVTDPSLNVSLPQLLDTLPGNVTAAAGTGADHINNIEQVVISNPAAGTYSLKVKGNAITQNPKQEYFLVYDTIPVSTELTYPIGAEHFKQGDSIYINWDAWGNPANTFTIEYSTDNGSNWSTIDNSVAADTRMYKWFVPSVITDQAKVRISCNGTGLSSTSAAFTILDIPHISLVADQNQCEGYIAVQWSAVSGATDYEVMMLQGQEMTAVGTTTGTTYSIGGLSKDSVYWVSVRARLNGNPGRRDTAVSRQPNTGNCQGSISNDDLKVDSILSPVSSGRKFTSTELPGSLPLTMRIKNLDDASSAAAITFSYSINNNTPVVDPPVSPVINAGATYDYTFLNPVDLSATGSYSIKVYIHKSADPIGTNDTLVHVFSQLTNPAIDLSSTFIDNIETATPQSFTTPQMGLPGLDRYDFINSTIYGRISTFVNTGISYSGSKALTLDADRFVSAGNTDSLTGTFNLSAYDTTSDDIRLDFRYKNHGQLANNANMVWIRGNDQQSWIQVYDLYANQNNVDGSFKLTPSIEIADSLKAHLQNFSSSFQVRWGQWGKILAADNFIGAGYTFDDIRLYKVTDDIQLVSIDTPIVSSCNLNATTPVTISVRNNMIYSTTPNLVPAEYRIDGGSWVSENMPVLGGHTTTQYTFTATANLSAPGAHLIEVRIVYPTDNYADNDTGSVSIVNSQLINTFPYLENFETGNGGWYGGGTNNSWQYGTPASSKINRAASGNKAWKTSMTGNYNDLENSYLYSPCFDIQGMTNPTLSLSLALDMEDCGSTFCDGAYFEYSEDGKIWTRLGANGQGTNWYNKNYSGNNIWSIQNYTRWHVASIPLPVGKSRLRLRLVFNSDLAVNREGIAIDDIHIYDNINGIYDGITMGSPVMQNITGGSGWIDFTSGGKLVASVMPNNMNMGNTDVQAYIYTGAVRISDNQYYHNRNITIKPANPVLSDSVTIRFYFLDSETESLINATGCSGCSKPATSYALGVSKYSDANDNNENGTVSDNIPGTWLFITPASTKIVPFDKGYYAEFKVKDFSEFWLNTGGINNDQPLPLQLINFSAKKQADKDVLAEWTTASEINVDRFDIEVAAGNSAYQQNNFFKIGTVVSQGNSTQQQNYSFTDKEQNKSGVRYYRLKMTDLDGRFSYSAVRPVVFNSEQNWQVYPNPSAGLFNLIYQLNGGEKMSVKIYDLDGKLVQQYDVIANGYIQKLPIDLRDIRFHDGLYFIEAIGGMKKQLFKMLKQ